MSDKRRLLSALNASLIASFSPSYARFRQALRRPQQAQRHVWQRVRASLQQTEVMRRYPDLARVDSVRELASAAPLSSYDDIQTDIAAMADGARNVRTNQTLLRFERSGGSSAMRKLIPQTQTFIDDMQHGLHAWLFDLYTHRPHLLSTSSYWSVSPHGSARETTRGGVSVGADDDAQYFTRLMQPILTRVLASHPALSRFQDVEACRYATLRLLIEREDLGLISVWSPTFLTLMLETLQAHKDHLLDDLRHGKLLLPHRAMTRGEIAAAKALPLTRNPARAAGLAFALQQTQVRAKDIWPRLSLVSCWTDASSATFSRALAHRLGDDVEIQAKGLLATEGIITLPLARALAPVLAVRSHVFEFLCDDTKICQPHELNVGDTVEVILSTTAGLLRYRLGDRVQVVGFYDDTPCLRFVGRGSMVSDRVGEKLSDAMVHTAIEQALRETTSKTPAFTLLAPDRNVDHPGYALYCEGLSQDEMITFARSVDDKLRESHPYEHARALSQLAPIHAHKISDGVRKFEARMVSLGQRAGDIKVPALSPRDDWHDVFCTSEGNDS